MRLIPLLTVTAALLNLFAAAAAQVPSVEVYCDPDQFQQMVDLYNEEIEIDCTVIVGDTIYAGSRIRLRGDTSRGYPKKSFRIDLPELQPLDGRIEWDFN